QVFRTRILDCLETAVYRQRATLWCSAVRDPLELVQELEVPAPECQRWTRLFEGFRRERISVVADAAAIERFRTALNARADVRQPVRDLIDRECTAAPELLRIGRMLVARLPKRPEPDEDGVLAEIVSEAQHFYEELWDGCATGEKVLLRQLAEEDVVNPN